MFRLPPTSIGISRNDLDSQLQEIDIYCGLLKQGFKKHEIIRYLENQKQSNSHVSSEKNALNKLQPAPSTLELSLRGSRREVVEDFANDEGRKNDMEEKQDEAEEISGSTHSVLPYGQRTYAPRNSSLLRFTHNVSSESSSTDLRNSVTHLPPVNIKYRPRTDTYSYEQSDRDESSSESDQLADVSLNLEHLTVNDEPSSVKGPIRIISPTSSTLSPKAKEFSPLQSTLPYATSSNNNITLPNDWKPLQHVTASLHTSPDLRIPRLVTAEVTGDRSNSEARKITSSSPALIATSRDEVQAHSNSSSPHLPSLARRSLEERTLSDTRGRHQYLDGSFTIYNDELPSQDQPQTPTELRRDHTSVYNAAYTAPPGMIRSEISQRGHSMHQLRQSSGEQSPTRRAITMRERRHREFLRGTYVEALRVGRRRQRATMLSPTMNGSNERTGEEELNLWRDELDADRIGEENFAEAGLGAVFASDIRAVSGNRRIV